MAGIQRSALRTVEFPAPADKAVGYFPAWDEMPADFWPLDLPYFIQEKPSFPSGQLGDGSADPAQTFKLGSGVAAPETEIQLGSGTI
jgi:hypothetical protein